MSELKAGDRVRVVRSLPRLNLARGTCGFVFTVVGKVARVYGMWWTEVIPTADLERVEGEGGE